MEKEDPAIVTNYLANDYDVFIAKLSSDVDISHGSTGRVDPKTSKKTVVVSKLHNDERVEGAAVVIHMEAIKEVTYGHVREFVAISIEKE
ncbi:hypothetical protein Tco_0630139 [Tanacetum coccineum]